MCPFTTGGNDSPRNKMQIQELAVPASGAGVVGAHIECSKKHCMIWAAATMGGNPAATNLASSNDKIAPVNRTTMSCFHIPVVGLDIERFSYSAHGPERGVIDFYVWGTAGACFLTIWMWE